MGSPAAIFWGRTVRGGAVTNLGRKEADVEKMQKLRAQAREWDRTRWDKNFVSDNTTFEVGDSVRYFDKGDWRNVGEVLWPRKHMRNEKAGPRAAGG